MMAKRVWGQMLPVGVRDGINKAFALPGVPASATAWIYLNGVLQWQVAAAPDINECIRAGAALTMRVAPESGDLFWVVWAAEGTSSSAELDAIVASSTAPAAAVYLQDIRDTFYFIVIIRDTAGNLKEIIDKDISAINWSYATLGGCLDAQIVLRRPFDQHGDIRRDYEVEIWRDYDKLGQAGARLPAQFGASGIALGAAHVGTRELRWSGKLFEKQAILSADGIGEHVMLRCIGWSQTLKRAFVNTDTYINQEVSAVAADLVDNHLLAKTKILRTPGLNLVQSTGVNINSIQFRTYGAAAFDTLAKIGGDCEWGVNAQKEFYFTPRQNAVRQTYAIGGRINLYQPLESSDDEVHRVYVQGGDGALYEINLAPFAPNNQKELYAQVGAISSNAAAHLWGTGFAAAHAPGNATPSGRLQLAGGADWIERFGHPIGLLRVIGGPVFTAAGDRLDTLLPVRLGSVYGDYTDQSFRIARVNYTPEEDSLRVDVELGPRGHSLEDLLESIEFKLNELAQGLIV